MEHYHVWQEAASGTVMFRVRNIRSAGMDFPRPAFWASRQAAHWWARKHIAGKFMVTKCMTGGNCPDLDRETGDYFPRVKR